MAEQRPGWLGEGLLPPPMAEVMLAPRSLGPLAGRDRVLPPMAEVMSRQREVSKRSSPGLQPQPRAGGRRWLPSRLMLPLTRGWPPPLAV
eukprot:2358142-Alexandrium_andersonii.AAC.1